MSDKRTQLSENQILIRLIILVLAILAVTWIADSKQSTKAPTTTSAATTSGPSDLKVVSGSNNSSSAQTANPQQTGTSLEGSNESVQSGQPNLQPADTISGMTDTFKQELGL